MRHILNILYILTPLCMSSSICKSGQLSCVECSSPDHCGKCITGYIPSFTTGGCVQWGYSLVEPCAAGSTECAPSYRWSKATSSCSDANISSLQSPININSSAVENRFHDTNGYFVPLVYDYPISNGILKTTEGLQYIEIDGIIGSFALLDSGMRQDYSLQKILFHQPSEHTIDGVYFPLEMQLQHMKDDIIVIISIFFDMISPNDNKKHSHTHEYFASIGLENDSNGSLPEAGESKEITTGLDVASTFNEQLSGPYYSYIGSITTPPCNEGTFWFIMKNRASISKSQLEAFKQRFPKGSGELEGDFPHGNSRYVSQKLNGREIRDGQSIVSCNLSKNYMLFSWTGQIGIAFFVSTWAIIYYAKPGSPLVHSFVCWLAYFSGAIGVVLLPADIAFTRCRGGFPNPLVKILWNYLYWITMFITFVALPIFMEYWASSKFTVCGKIGESLYLRVQFIGIAILVGIPIAVLIVYTDSFSMTPLIMAMSNAYGLFLITATLGHGLSAVPIALWRGGNYLDRIALLEWRAEHVQHKHVKSMKRLSRDISRILSARKLMDNQCSKQLKERMSILVQEAEKAAENTTNAIKEHITSLHHWDIERECKKKENNVMIFVDKITSEWDRSEMLKEIGFTVLDTEKKQLSRCVALRYNLNMAIKYELRRRTTWYENIKEWRDLSDLSQNKSFAESRWSNRNCSVFARFSWYWNKYLGRIVYKLSSIIAWMLSIVVLTDQFTVAIPGRHSIISYCFSYIPPEDVALSHFVIFVPLFYLTLCTFYSLMTIKLPGCCCGFFDSEAGASMLHIYPRRKTDIYALMFFGCYINRMQFSIGYNFLCLLQAQATPSGENGGLYKSSFSQLYRFETGALFKYAFTMFPVATVLMFFLSITKAYRRCLQCCFGDLDTDMLNMSSVPSKADDACASQMKLGRLLLKDEAYENNEKKDNSLRKSVRTSSKPRDDVEQHIEMRSSDKVSEANRRARESVHFKDRMSLMLALASPFDNNSQKPQPPKNSQVTEDINIAAPIAVSYYNRTKEVKNIKDKVETKAMMDNPTKKSSKRDRRASLNNGILKEGWLKIRHQATFGRVTWGDVWCVLKIDCSLSWYDEKTNGMKASNKLGSLMANVYSASATSITAISSRSFPFGIGFSKQSTTMTNGVSNTTDNSSYTYVFAMENEEEQDEWLNALHDALNAHSLSSVGMKVNPNEVVYSAYGRTTYKRPDGSQFTEQDTGSEVIVVSDTRKPGSFEEQRNRSESLMEADRMKNWLEDG